jgi:hypothetical protein
MPASPDHLLPGEDLNAYHRRIKFRDAAPPEGEDEDDSEMHLHIHLGGSGAGQDLPESVGSANLPAGKQTGAPVNVTRDTPTMQPGKPSHLPKSKPLAAKPQQINDQEELEGEEGEGEGNGNKQVIGTLSPLDEDGYVYKIVMNPDNSASIIKAIDDGTEELNSVNTGDNRRSWSDARSKQIVAAMNKNARAYHVRDAASTKEQTIFRHYNILPDEKLVLRGPNEYGAWDLILISPTSDLLGKTPVGAQELDDVPIDEDYDTFPLEGHATQPGRSNALKMPGSKVGDSASMLRAMNSANKRFWARK